MLEPPLCAVQRCRGAVCLHLGVPVEEYRARLPRPEAKVPSAAAGAAAPGSSDIGLELGGGEVMHRGSAEHDLDPYGAGALSVYL